MIIDVKQSLSSTTEDSKSYLYFCPVDAVCEDGRRKRVRVGLKRTVCHSRETAGSGTMGVVLAGCRK